MLSQNKCNKQLVRVLRFYDYYFVSYSKKKTKPISLKLCKGTVQLIIFKLILGFSSRFWKTNKKIKNDLSQVLNDGLGKILVM